MTEGETVTVKTKLRKTPVYIYPVSKQDTNRYISESHCQGGVW